MGEIYTGPKFQTKFLSRSVPDHVLCPDLIDWCHRIAQLGMAPAGGEAGNAGNLSVRTESGFIITGAGTNLTTIDSSQLVVVFTVNLEKNIVEAAGSNHPSSESLLHYHIYSTKPGVNAVIHGHYDKFFKEKDKLGIPETDREIEYGTGELGSNTASLLGNGGFILMKNHGFLSAGHDLNAAGNKLLEIFESIK